MTKAPAMAEAKIAPAATTFLPTAAFLLPDEPLPETAEAAGDPDTLDVDEGAAEAMSAGPAGVVPVTTRLPDA